MIGKNQLCIFCEFFVFNRSSLSQVITSLKHKLHSMERLVKSKDNELRY